MAVLVTSVAYPIHRIFYPTAAILLLTLQYCNTAVPQLPNSRHLPIECTPSCFHHLSFVERSCLVASITASRLLLNSSLSTRCLVFSISPLACSELHSSIACTAPSANVTKLAAVTSIHSQTLTIRSSQPHSLPITAARQQLPYHLPAA